MVRGNLMQLPPGTAFPGRQLTSTTNRRASSVQPESCGRMKFPGSRAARVLYSAILLLPLSSLSSAPTPAVPDTPAFAPGESEITAKGETRLRKLHLVRPDLIPYPIAFEVYC
jgi:hypothetical protein